MVTLEQVKLLETKVGKALAYIDSLSAENTTLREKLDGYRRRIDELETIVLAFKEDQGRIEAGIISALERLNQFEDAVERGIDDIKTTPSDEAPEMNAAEQTATPSVSPQSSDDEESGVAVRIETIEEEPESEAEAADEKNGELDIF